VRPANALAADLDVRFHDLIYRADGNDRMHEAWQNIRSQVYIFLLLRNVAKSVFRSEAVIAHPAILDVPRGRDGPAAAEVIEGHIRLSYGRVLERFPDVGSEPAASA
jgi:DNA-binding GntR family transcriptional regulator